MRWIATIGLAGLALTACGEAADEASTNDVEVLPADESDAAGDVGSADVNKQEPTNGEDSGDGDQPNDGGDSADNTPGAGLPPAGDGLRFVGLWASKAENCGDLAWRFTADRLQTPAGSVCTFKDVKAVPGGYDIAASCTAEAPPRDDTLEIRFAESAKAMLFESNTIADAGLVYCGRS